jgi:hypothetical protein
MRVIGPKVKFIYKKRTASGSVGVHGQKYTFPDSGTFYGVINAVPRQPDGQNTYEGKIGVQIHYELRTMFDKLTEQDRIQMDGTTRVFNIVKVDDILEQGKYWVVKLNERKE